MGRIEKASEVSWWKKLLSYFKEIHIETLPSTYNQQLHILLKQGRFMLCTDEAVYSYEDKYNNFGAAFDRLKLDQMAIDNCLLLGFGLGSIPILLEERGMDEVHYTGIEIDEAVIDLASRYGLPAIKAPVSMIRADAGAFVEQCTEHFDLVAVDLFIDDLVPDPFLSRDFLKHCSGLLREDGLLLFNRLALTKHDIEESDAYFKMVFRTVFPDAVFIHHRGNRILVSDERYLRST